MSFFAAIPRSFGFTKTYNFILYFIFAGALFGFSLSRFMYLNINGIFCNPDSKVGNSLPGNCYYYSKGRDRIGILLHLGAILPASILVVFQFMPIIRHKFLIIHRISGYIILLLTLISTAGVFMILRNAFAGAIEVQTAGGLANIILITCLSLGFYNVKKLQLEQHRAWMMRGWVMAAFIITLRLLAVIYANIISKTGPYFSTRPCYVVDHMLRHNSTAVLARYPTCERYYSGVNVEQVVPTLAKMGDGADGTASAFNVSFGAAGWLALAIHCIAVEVYLHLTPAEAQRLRRVSYERQLERGMKNPGNEGLTVQRVGYAEEWKPKAER